MNTIFNESVSDIERQYKDMNYQLGWRFIGCSKSVLNNSPEIALITLNPGGDSIQPDHPSESCEHGHSYLVEKWGNAAPGRSPLQTQLQAMFAKIAQQLGRDDRAADLMERSLPGYYIPFRSQRLIDLPNRQKAVAFAETLWTNVLREYQTEIDYLYRQRYV